MIRLQKILSAAGVASRRAAEDLIRHGRVTVNGAVVRELGTRADPARDEIRVDGQRVKTAQRLRYLLLNKPRGYVTTRSDPQGRPTVLQLLKGIPEYVYPVGRLDYDSEGLLLLTNDGELAARLMHPRHEVERVYEARVLGIPDTHDLDRLGNGVIIDGRRTAPAEVALLRSTSRYPQSAWGPTSTRSKTSRSSVDSRARVRGGALRALKEADSAVLLLTIHEGRTRQVRKMCEAVGHPVVRLRRVRIGPVADRSLKPGGFRELTADEIESLKRAAQRTERS